MGTESHRLDWMLNGFTDRVEGVHHSLVLSGDGLLLGSSRELTPERADQLAAVVAGLVSLTQHVAGSLEMGPVLRTIVEMNRNLLFVMMIGDDEPVASIASLAQEGCDVGEVAFQMTSLVNKAGELLATASRPT